MEHVHLHLFPAVGSHKEKRLAHFAGETPDHNPATTEVEDALKQAEGLKETSTKVEADAARGKIESARKKVKKLEEDASTATDRKAGLKILDQHVDPLTKKIEDAHKKHQDIMVKVIAREAKGQLDGIRNADARPAVDPEKPFADEMAAAAKDKSPSLPLLMEYAKALRSIREAKVANTKEITPDPAKPAEKEKVFKGAAKVPEYPRPDAMKKALDAYEAALADKKADKLGSADKLVSATDALRKTLVDHKAGALKEIADNPLVDIKVMNAEQYEDTTKLLADLDKRTGTAPTTPETKTEAKPEEIETKYKTQIDALKGIDGKKPTEITAILDDVNTKVPEGDRAAVVKQLEGKLAKYTIVLDKATNKVDAQLKTSTEGKETEEALTVKKLVELIMKFLGEVGILPKEMVGKLDANRIDTKIADLKAEKAKLDPTKVDDKKKIDGIDKYIKELEGAKPIVVEAAKIGVTVNVDADGHLTFEGPADKVAKIQGLLSGLRVKFKPEGGKIEISKLDPRALEQILIALQQLTMAYRPGGYGPGYGPGYAPAYGFGANGYWNGARAGFDVGGNPYAQTQSYDMGQKAYQGASNKRA